MRRYTLLLTLILTCIVALGSAQTVLAATTASQTVTGTLAQMKQVVADGGNLGTSIDPSTGALGIAFSPTFIATTNTNASTNMAFTGTCNTTGLAQNAFFGNGTVGGTFIVLTNNTILPTVANVNDAKAVTPVPANNPDVIAYGVLAPSATVGQLTFAWNNTNKNWDGTLTHKGNTSTTLTVPAATPRALTYSFDDDPGSYEATVTLSFV